jgi:peptidoglycan/LPS O-acetylase OafA/YrhL
MKIEDTLSGVCLAPTRLLAEVRRPNTWSIAKHSSELLSYRPHLDGLRALAVALVVGFHAFPNLIPGGFIGVDIFFVLSGFLISSNIYTRLADGTFSYTEFYIRRIRRIYPALIVVVAATLAIGWMLLLDDEYRNLGTNAFAASVFGSNLLLWSEAGYFDTLAAYKQLLNLWSLGIEEQFYLIWPCLVAILWRRGRPLALAIVFIVVSFGLSVGLTYREPAAAFYLPFARFWELMAGGVLAYLQRRRHGWLRFYPELQAALGLTLILAGAAAIDEISAFPGWLVLLPVSGAFLLISAGPRASVNRLVLSNPLAVAIGLISYPLYLWHWPLLSFLRVLEGGVLPPAKAAAAISLSVVLAAATYLLVEGKIRKLGHGGLVAIALVGVLTSIGIGGLAIRVAGGFPAREANRLSAHDFSRSHGLENVLNECGMTTEQRHGIASCASDKRGTPIYAVLGDSKAAALFPGLVRESDSQGRWMLIGGNGPHGAPVPVISSARMYQSFQPMTVAASDALVRNPSIRVVVLVTAIRALFQNGDGLLRNLSTSPNDAIVFDGLDRMIAKLTAAGKTVVLMVDNPALADPHECVVRKTGVKLIDRLMQPPQSPYCAISITESLRETRIYRDLLERLSAKWGRSLIIYDPTDVLCIKERNICPSAIDGHTLYSYDDHISDYGNGRIARELIPLVERVAQRGGPVRIHIADER